jgi:hypothetical protein
MVFYNCSYEPAALIATCWKESRRVAAGACGDEWSLATRNNVAGWLRQKPQKSADVALLRFEEGVAFALAKSASNAQGLDDDACQHRSVSR